MRPALPLVGLLLAWAVVGLLTSAGWLHDAIWSGFGCLLVVLLSVDAFRLWRQPFPDVARRVPEALPVGVERSVELLLDNGGAPLQIDVHDLHPEGWQSVGLPLRLQLMPNSETRMEYALRPVERGDAVFAGIHLRIHSPWRFWQRSRVLGKPQLVRVFPNFAPLAKFALLGIEQASRALGAHVRRRRGEGTDFHQMRDYRIGDSLRQVDWKATARMRRLISREYQDERNQHVLLVLDTGQRMFTRDGVLSHFDQALDAALVVAWLALRQGDAVGFLASGGDQRWVPPQRGVSAIDVLLHQTYDLQPQPVATDYLSAAANLSLLQRRRSLVILISNLRDEDADDLLSAVRMLQQRHHVVVVSLREQVLDTVLEKDVHDLREAVRVAAAAEYLQKRAAAHAALRARHVDVLDVTCAQLPVALVERYLAIKREGVL